MLSISDKNEIMLMLKQIKDELRKEIFSEANSRFEGHTDNKDAVAAVFTPVAESGGIEDGKIAEHADLLRSWEASKHYYVGNLCAYDGMAFRVRQEHDSQDIYPPTIAASLYERVAEHGQGTHDNPIPYDASVGMALENGKFYTEDDVLYECFRDTGVPIYQPLSALVEIYVRVSN